MQILVLGASGMLGHQACRVLSGSNEVHAALRCADDIGIYQQTFFRNCILHDRFDALNNEQFTALISHLRPDVVLNCIGVVKQVTHTHDPVMLIRINALLPHLVARTCTEVGSKLIQVSTDCVFSGKSGHYTEGDLPDPVDMYGRTKLLGEVSHSPHLTIRTSVFGRQLNGKYGLLEWFLSHKDRQVQGYRQAYFSGLTTRALCEIIKKILDRAFDITGTYHVAGASISKFELLSLINDRLSLGSVVNPDDSLVCDRSLDSRHFLQATGIAIPSYDSMIGQLAGDNQNYE